MAKRRERGLRHVVAHVYGTPLTVKPDKLAEVQSFLELRAAGHRFSREELRIQLGDQTLADRPEAYVENGIAVLPAYGVLAPRMNMMMEISGGTSMNLFGQAFDAAVANSQIRAVVIDA